MDSSLLHEKKDDAFVEIYSVSSSNQSVEKVESANHNNNKNIKDSKDYELNPMTFKENCLASVILLFLILLLPGSFYYCSKICGVFEECPPTYLSMNTSDEQISWDILMKSETRMYECPNLLNFLQDTMDSIQTSEQQLDENSIYSCIKLLDNDNTWRANITAIKKEYVEFYKFEDIDCEEMYKEANNLIEMDDLKVVKSNSIKLNIGGKFNKSEDIYDDIEVSYRSEKMVIKHKYELLHFFKI
ncbi:hypothetical protein C6P40_002126 [Pichia californica]|uniref:Uncharacterized protein n=1 Tax=Pichia californica TaxID=460514 RepID=A0A9P6WP16_9ASCO|nr:hypothetical protein C6P42_001380 [[Candida] californica]KAG0690627.1 hypothetical protein C6P40_002126 [[Candida] californica]